MHLRVLLLLLASAVVAHADIIDLTPRYENAREDGVSIRRMYFVSGGVKIIYEPPADCDVRGGGTEIRLVPKDLSEAEARIGNNPVATPPEFDAEGVKVYRAIAESLIPKHAEAVVPRHEKQDAIPINDWRGFEKAFTYTQSGRRFVRAVLFIKLDQKREIRLIVTSRESDFDAFYSRVFASLNTWLEVGL